MSYKTQRAREEYLESLERKPAAKDRHAKAMEAYELHRKRKAALLKLTNGGFLIPKPEVLKEGLEELREVGHKKADIVQRINRRKRG